MGVGDYILPYKTNKERDLINAAIERYKNGFIDKFKKKDNYRKFIELYCPLRDEISVKNGIMDNELDYYISDEQSNEIVEKIKKENSDIDFTYIDTNEICEKENPFDLLIECHQRLEFKKGKKTFKAIRVFFNCGLTSSFHWYLEISGVKKIFWNESWIYEWDIVECYPCITKDENGDDLPQSIC